MKLKILLSYLVLIVVAAVGLAVMAATTHSYWIVGLMTLLIVGLINTLVREVRRTAS